MADFAATLAGLIDRRTATVAVVGLGYVGLPLVRAIHDAGFPVIGYDIDPAKIEKLRLGEPYIHHLAHVFESLKSSKRFTPTADSRDLGKADVILLCVPTPLGVHHEPDLSYVIQSTEMVARTLRRGQLIILESTTYPGTTRDEMLPILEKGGLKCGRDFFLAYSPEREDPGSPGRSATDIPKVVGGVDDASADLAVAVYSSIAPKVHRVSSAEVAEASKLLENIYRSVNIALVNELKLIFAEMGIDVWEVIGAASTKPFGFQPFFPGPGLGGHCIPIDPYYLAWKARSVGRTTKFIELAGEINATMPRHVVERVGQALNEQGKPIRGSRILIIGVAYKPNIDDMRETPAAEIIELLQHAGAVVSYHDPHIRQFPAMRRYQIALASQPLTPEVVGRADCVLIVTNHASIDYELIGREADLVVDSRNAMECVRSPKATIVKA